MNKKIKIIEMVFALIAILLSISFACADSIIIGYDNNGGIDFNMGVAGTADCWTNTCSALWGDGLGGSYSPAPGQLDFCINKAIEYASLGTLNISTANYSLTEISKGNACTSDEFNAGTYVTYNITFYAKNQTGTGCSCDSECGPISYGSPFCDGNGNVARNKTTPRCINHECLFSNLQEVIHYCNNGCSNSQCLVGSQLRVNLLYPENNSILNFYRVGFIYNISGTARSCNLSVSGRNYGNTSQIIQGNNNVSVDLENSLFSAYVFCFDENNNRVESNRVNFSVNAPTSLHCTVDSDCGPISYGSPFCDGNGNVARNKTTPRCAINSLFGNYCSYQDVLQEVSQICPNGCFNGICNGQNETSNPVVNLLFPQNNSSIISPFNFVFTVNDSSEIRTCAVNVSGSLFENLGSPITKNSNNTVQAILSPGNYSAYVFCYDTFMNRGESNRINFSVRSGQVCSSKADCGQNKFTGSAFCKNGDVYQSYIEYDCISGSCSISTSDKLKKNCLYGCSNGACKPNPHNDDEDYNVLDNSIQITSRPNETVILTNFTRLNTEQSPKLSLSCLWILIFVLLVLIILAIFLIFRNL